MFIHSLKRDRETESELQSKRTHLLVQPTWSSTHQMHCPSWGSGRGRAVRGECNPGLPGEWEESSYSVDCCCLLLSSLTGSWTQSRSGTEALQGTKYLSHKAQCSLPNPFFSPFNSFPLFFLNTHFIYSFIIFTIFIYIYIYIYIA